MSLPKKVRSLACFLVACLCSKSQAVHISLLFKNVLFGSGFANGLGLCGTKTGIIVVLSR